MLAQHPYALGLGEVSSYFDSGHMTQYIGKWGCYPDARLCSCGTDWNDCQFWGNNRELSGLESNGSMKEKYLKMINFIATSYGQNTIIVDSSKRFNSLRMLSEHIEEMGIEKKNLYVIMVVKDVRSFAASIHSKKWARRSLVRYRRTFNWWYSEYKKLLDYIEKHEINFLPVLYEKFCNEPESHVNKVYKMLGVPGVGRNELNHGNSHIAMGNKDFVMRNRERIRYDQRWFLEDGIGLVYMFSRKIRCFNKRLYHY